jgi:hypothetical protein
LGAFGRRVIWVVTIEVAEQGAGQGAVAGVAGEFHEPEEVFARKGPESGVRLQA